MALFLKLTELCGCEEKTDVEAELQGAVETAMKSSILAEEGEDEDAVHFWSLPCMADIYVQFSDFTFYIVSDLFR